MKKKLFLLQFLFAVFFACSGYAQQNDYAVNFKNVPMKDFITFVSEFTGKNVIYNEADLRGNVTISSQKNMDAKEILDIFYSVMKLNGYQPVTKGDSIQIVAEKDMQAFDEEIKINGVGRNAKGYITTVVSLENYNAATILPVLNRMKSKTGYVEAVKGLNIVVVRDDASRIEKMTALINKVDNVAAGYEFYTLPLKYSIASKIEQQITKFFNELAKNSINPTSPVVISDDISNTLIIAATKKDYERISTIISNLDTKNMAINTEPRVFYLKNARAEDVEKVLSKLVTSLSQQAGKTGSTTSSSSSNSKVSISSDNATNSILAIGDKELYDNLDSLISKLDVPRRQVYVEALILETTIDKSSQFGVEWFMGAGNQAGAIIGSNSNAGSLGSIIGSLTQGASNISGLGTGLGVGVIGNIISFQGAKFPSIGALVSALRSSSGINIISNPQILTLNNSAAEVFVGENMPYQTSTKFDSNNNPIQTYDYRDVGVKLKVTPQITSDDMVTLAIEQEIKQVADSSVGSTAPTTLTRSTNTSVKLKNHSIMVISGMIRDDSTRSVSGIPGISQIPVLGWLFKRETTTIRKTNVMLFITAHIIDTIEDNNKLMDSKRTTMEDFNRDGDKTFRKGAFTDTGRSIQLKNDIEGLSPEEAQKTQRQRDKEKEKREKAERKAEKERQKAIKKAEKKAEKEAEKEAEQTAKEDEKAVEENTKLLTPAATDNNAESETLNENNELITPVETDNNTIDNTINNTMPANQPLNNEDTGIISPENQGE